MTDTFPRPSPRVSIHPAHEAINHLVDELREASLQSKSQDLDWALGKALEAQAAASRITIVLCGVAGSGKDTVAEYLRKKYIFTVDSFAAPLKTMVKHAFPEFSDEHLYGDSSQRAYAYTQYPLNPASPYFKKGEREFVSPRVALQTLGTDWGRSLNDRIWVDAAFARLKDARRAVITDGRFKNEVLVSRANGAIVVRLARGLRSSTDPHPSEAELRQMADIEFDYVLGNDLSTTVERLYEMVDGMMEAITHGIKSVTFTK